MSKPGQNKGSKNFKAKLSDSDVLFIFENQHNHTEQDLADRFNVSQSTINHIKNGRTWSWLTKKNEETRLVVNSN